MKRSQWLASILAMVVLGVSLTAVSALTYHVTWGDTLTNIANRFGTSISNILQANPQISNPNLIFIGQELEIPTDDTPPNPTPVPSPPPSSTPTPASSQTYIVQPGDTLSAIARRFNSTVAAIAQASGISNINLIFVGQLLTIPGSGPIPTPLPPPPTTPSPPQEPDFALGAQTLTLDNKVRIQEAGMTWIKFQYKWPSKNSLDELEKIIDTAHDEDFKILVTISGDTAYPTANSINFLDYIEFVQQVAALKPDGIEIWNEMNIDFEWPAGQISPSSYVNNMLAPAYTAIKTADPNILVISGALAPTGFDNDFNAWSDSRYLTGLRAAGAANYLDCVGVHYNAGATSPSATSGHPADPGERHYSWYYMPTLTLYRNAFSSTRDLCLTEFGYLSPEGFDGVPAGFSWATNTTLAQQASWLAEATQIASNSGYIRLAIVFNLDFIKYEVAGDPQAGYAIIRLDGSCPACASLGNVMK